MAEKPRWAPDSWVKLILIGCLTIAFLLVTAAMSYRAIHSEVNISMDTVSDVFNQFIGLFGVVVGYTLGSRKD